ncbi:MAG: YiiX family permuted papain-like enzyme [Flavipsychrobacter sp.]|nr:YiiX family permuted papain-like enzyme [Flavipsychrobacter sp.]
MKNTTILFILFLATYLSAGCGPDTDKLKEGDIIFQSSKSGQSYAIQLATKSQYSHCGIIYKDGDNFYVYEAIQPVKKTLLKDWIARGDDDHYVIKRLKNRSVLTPAVLEKMKDETKSHLDKDYDIYFGWSDNDMYCSELVWKAYKRAAGIEVGKLQKLREFDLSHPVVQKKVQERYGNDIPLDETVISPASIFESELLEVVKED